jgi:SAM-dependent methyltransferase
VREAVVVVREDMPGDRRLVAYVVRQPSRDTSATTQSGPDRHGERVASWRDTWERTYGARARGRDERFDTIGWISSYTREPIAADEMREWLDHTVDGVLALSPRRVLEIGCGTGMLLFRIAPRCDRYCGTDFSSAVVRDLRAAVDADPALASRVSVVERSADQLEGLEAGWDAVVLNSVAQYFPSVEYLWQVLARVVALVRPGGTVSVGDVRNLSLLEALHAGVATHQAPPTLSLAELRKRVARRMAQEQELVVDPALFRTLSEHLPEISHVSIQVKRGRSRNELTRFRYDVLLHVGGTPASEPAAERIDWTATAASLSSLRQVLERGLPPALVVTGVPNGRVADDLAAVAHLAAGRLATVADLRAALVGSPPGVDPEELWSLGESLGYTAEVTWGEADPRGGLDVTFRRGPAPRAITDRPEDRARVQPTPDLRPYANEPLREAEIRALVPELRAFAQAALPEYMVPAAVVVLDALPLSPSGKVDRRALPPPEDPRPEDRDHVAPRTPAECAVAEIWQDVLGVPGVGAHDNFFDLGGHSLLAVKVLARIEQRLGRRLHPGDLILQTVAQVAAQVTGPAPAAEAAKERGLGGGVLGALTRIVRRG